MSKIKKYLSTALLALGMMFASPVSALAQKPATVPKKVINRGKPLIVSENMSNSLVAFMEFVSCYYIGGARAELELVNFLKASEREVSDEEFARMLAAEENITGHQNNAFIGFGFEAYKKLVGIYILINPLNPKDLQLKVMYNFYHSFEQMRQLSLVTALGASYRYYDGIGFDSKIGARYNINNKVNIFAHFTLASNPFTEVNTSSLGGQIGATFDI